MLSRLILAGTGLGTGDISREAIKQVGRCNTVFWEGYTSLVPGRSAGELGDFFRSEIIPLDRESLEDGSIVMDALSSGDVAILVAGDPMISTTHVALRVQAARNGHGSIVIHSSSIITAAMGESCLQATRFGRVATISFLRSKQPYDVLSENRSRGLHTLFLLDVDVEEDRYMTVKDALRSLESMEMERGEGTFSVDMLVIGLARISLPNQVVRAAPARVLLSEELGPPPHSLIVPGGLHFAESEAIDVLLAD